jgi:hypothetical protein
MRPSAERKRVSRIELESVKAVSLQETASYDAARGEIAAFSPTYHSYSPLNVSLR